MRLSSKLPGSTEWHKRHPIARQNRYHYLEGAIGQAHSNYDSHGLLGSPYVKIWNIIATIIMGMWYVLQENGICTNSNSQHVHVLYSAIIP